MKDEKDIKQALGITLILTILLVTFFPVTLAEQENVAVNWYIPDNINLDITYPTGLTSVDFRPATSTFGRQNAHKQVGGTPALNVTNAGNTDIDIALNLSGNLPTGVYYFNVSSAYGSTNATQGSVCAWWGDWNETTQATINDTVCTGQHINYYCYSSGDNVNKGDNSTWPLTQDLVLISSKHT